MFPLTAPALSLPAPFDTWSAPALVALGVVVLIDVALLVTALVVWARTPDGAIPAPNRWVWLAVLLVQVVGPITFLVLRRRAAEDARARQELAAADASRTGATPPPAATPGRPSAAGSAGQSAAESTADLLYGSRDG